MSSGLLKSLLILSPSLLFSRFHDSVHPLILPSRLSPTISLQSISLERERVRNRNAFQSVRELQTNNMHLSPWIPNSDSRRLLAKGPQTSWGHLPLSSLIMFLRHSMETAETHYWAFVLTYIYIKKVVMETLLTANVAPLWSPFPGGHC